MTCRRLSRPIPGLRLYSQPPRYHRHHHHHYHSAPTYLQAARQHAPNPASAAVASVLEAAAHLSLDDAAQAQARAHAAAAQHTVQGQEAAAVGPGPSLARAIEALGPFYAGCVSMYVCLWDVGSLCAPSPSCGGNRFTHGHDGNVAMWRCTCRVPSAGLTYVMCPVNQRPSHACLPQCGGGPRLRPGAAGRAGGRRGAAGVRRLPGAAGQPTRRQRTGEAATGGGERGAARGGRRRLGALLRVGSQSVDGPCGDALPRSSLLSSFSTSATPTSATPHLRHPHPAAVQGAAHRPPQAGPHAGAAVAGAGPAQAGTAEDEAESERSLTIWAGHCVAYGLVCARRVVSCTLVSPPGAAGALPAALKCCAGAVADASSGRIHQARGCATLRCSDLAAS